jgi:lipid II:glycine glycyltransferase (peptidoglycan interpeptide bridge formation enzyme)
VRPATPAEIEDWDALVAANPDGGHMLQTRAWGEAKRRWGWQPVYRVAELEAGTPGRRIAVLFLRRRVPGLGWLWYCPKGPGVVSVAQLRRVLADRSSLEGAFAVEVEPEIADTPENRSALEDLGLRKVEDVQIARATLCVDLSADEDAILASFRPKTRYNVRLAARRGVSVSTVPCEPDAVAAMHRLMGMAFRHAGLPLRPLPYYAAYWRLFEASGQGALFLARLGEEVLAGAYVVWFGEKGWYKDGGSSPRHREVMAPHLLQWEVMRFLRARGVRSYDLFAAPRRADLDDPANPVRGLWQFKSGFSEDLREFVGTWADVMGERRDWIWRRMGEPVTRRVRWRLRGDLLY